MLSGWESLTPRGRDTNPSQVSPQQKLVLILPTSQGWKAESTLKVTQNMFNTQQSRDLNPVERQRSYHCANHAPVPSGGHIVYLWQEWHHLRPNPAFFCWTVKMKLKIFVSLLYGTRAKINSTPEKSHVLSLSSLHKATLSKRLSVVLSVTLRGSNWLTCELQMHLPETKGTI